MKAFRKHLCIAPVVVALILIVTLALLATTRAARADGPIYVKAGGSGSGSCDSWENACELQYALQDVASSGDEIWVAAGVYTPTTYGGPMQSCQDIRDADPAAPDGEYLISPGGHDFTVYCHDMAGTPREYLTLPARGAQNYSQYTAGFPWSNVRTRYDRVRINPATLVVDIGDQTFASSTGHLEHGDVDVTSMPYGVAMDCIANYSSTGVARIDLRDTAFVVSDTFSLRGWAAAGTATFSSNDQVVDLTGGGYCGWIAADPTPYPAYNEMEHFSLDLEPAMPDRAASFRLKSGVALYGGFAGSETSRDQRDWSTHVTVLSGDLDGDDVSDPNGVITTTAHILGSNAYHVVTGSGVTETAVLDGFIITGGNADGSNPYNRGGGMYNDNGSPALVNVTFSGNSAYDGGGMCNGSGSPALTNVTFSGNSADYGGGAGTGGGMYNNSGNPRLTDVTFSGNSAGGGEGGEGGGMYNNSGSPELVNVTFSGNSADYAGGGMYNNSGSPELVNVTFSGNSADYGGGVYNRSSSPELVNVTFSGNSAYGGGGMYNDESSPTVDNCILWGNTDDGTGQEAQIYNDNSTITVTYSLVGGGVYAGTGNISGDPLFVRDPRGALRFDGVNDYVEANSVVDDLTADGPISFGGWVRPAGGTTGQKGLFAFHETDGVNRNIVFFLANDNRFSYFDPEEEYQNSMDTFPPGEWYHVMTVIDDSGSENGTLYVNGVAQKTFTTTVRPDTNGQFSIGQEWDGAHTSDHFRGLIDEVAIFDRALSAAEVTAIYKSGWNSVDGKVLALHLDENPVFEGDTLSDSSGLGNDGTLHTGDTYNKATVDCDLGCDLRLQRSSPAIDAGDNSAVPADTLDLDGDGDTAEPLPLDLDGSPRFVDIPTRPDTGVGPAPIVDMGAYEAQIRVYLPLVLNNH